MIIKSIKEWFKLLFMDAADINFLKPFIRYSENAAAERYVWFDSMLQETFLNFQPDS